MATITIRDVAKYAGVGIGTVSRVINGGESVSASTRAKVLAAIAALDYTPNQTARRLSLGKTHTIGVIVPFLTSPSYIERIRGIESVFANSTYDFLIFNADSPEKRRRYLREATRAERFDGTIFVTIAPTDRQVARFRERRMPCVLIEGHRPDLSRIFVNNVFGGYQATKYLIDLGHRQIGYVTDYLENENDSQPINDRFLGYLQALEEADILYRPDYVVQGIHGRHEGRDLAYQLLSLESRPTAIFAYSDTQALGVLEAARNFGLVVPDDLSVIGFDDIDIAQFISLTTISQSLFESGVAGAEALLLAMDKGQQVVDSCELPTRLIIRGTTGPAPNMV